MSRVRVLAVEDDTSVQYLLRHAAEAEGLDLTVEPDGPKGLATAQSFKPDLAILDVMLPGPFDGFDVARRLHDRCDVGVLFLTGATTLEDRLAGFRAGGDDYLTKPFYVEELQARITAILRRRGLSAAAIWRVGDLSVDNGAREVFRGEDLIELTRTEFELISVLVRRPGRVVHRAALATEVWGYEQSGNVMEAHMSSLRRKLEAYGDRCIHTVRGVGYVVRNPRPGADR
ncbi:MAG TPA: response regulator transcription factor [Acidimicrobiales bacterium]|jgi:two-component system OmpR family response regulator